MQHKMVVDVDVVEEVWCCHTYSIQGRSKKGGGERRRKEEKGGERMRMEEKGAE